MSGHPVKMPPELRTSLLTEVVLAALGVASEGAPPVRVETTGPYTAVLTVAESNLRYGGVRLALTTCVGGVSRAVVSAIWRPGASEPLRERRAVCMERLAEAIEAEPGVTEAVLDETYGASVLVQISYGRARIIREGNNG
jgi:hypothetical protein